MCLHKSAVKIIYSLLLIFISYGLLQAIQTPAVSYESSIYSASPPLLVGAILLTAAISLVVLIINIFYWRHRLYTILSLLLMGFAVISCVILFYIRSYYLFGLFDDPAFHLGAIKVILDNGFLFESLFYPIVHILTAEAFYVTNIDLVELSKIIPILFHLLFLIFFAALVNISLKSGGEKLLALAIGSIFVHMGSVFFTPNALWNMYFPMIIYVIVKSIKSPQIEWKIILTILLLLTPVFHPLAPIYTIIILSAFSILYFINKYQICPHIGTNKLIFLLKGTMNDKTFLLSLIVVVWSIYWISQFYIYDYHIDVVYRSFARSVDETQFESLINRVSYADSLELNLLELLLKHYSFHVSILCISFVSWIYYVKNEKNSPHYRILQGYYIALAIIIVCMTFSLFFEVPFSILRFLNLTSLIGITVVAYFLYHFTARLDKNYKLVAVIILLILLIFLTTNGIMKFYPSTYTHLTNPQSCASEVTGLEWYFSHKQLDIELKGITLAPGRAAEFLIPQSQVISQNNRYSLYLNEEKQPPKHFGYTYQSHLGQSFENAEDIILLERDKIRYTELFPELGAVQWNIDDFKRLQYDKTVNRLYYNGNLELWAVKPVI